MKNGLRIVTKRGTLRFLSFFSINDCYNALSSLIEDNV
jgi:hypothetical protein